MKQHIFGFILFALIVGTAGLISAFFTELPSRDAIKVFEVPKTVEYKSSCWKQVKSSAENSSARVVQATFNQKTKQLETDLLIERETSSVEKLYVSLHFFTKDAGGTRYLATEKLWLEPFFNRNNTASQSITSSYKWRDELGSYENLYVVAGTKNSIPRFNESNAVAVVKSF
ncbi:MAG TPA: hypothetical protein VK892_20385 [Pyrinomonadaceae bacterium]|nr:hypothetical protein [Pyrinomonadaceae bacterium]